MENWNNGLNPIREIGMIKDLNHDLPNIPSFHCSNIPSAHQLSKISFTFR